MYCIPTGWSISYRKYILQITQPSQYRYAKLQYRFAVISGSPSIVEAKNKCGQLCPSFHLYLPSKQLRHHEIFTLPSVYSDKVYMDDFFNKHLEVYTEHTCQGRLYCMAKKSGPRLFSELQYNKDKLSVKQRQIARQTEKPKTGKKTSKQRGS